MAHPITDTANSITSSYSLEVSVKDIRPLTSVSSRVPRGTTISIPYLSNQGNEDRLAAAKAVKALGLKPMLHLSARRIASLAELSSFIHRAVHEAGVEACLVVAGDPTHPVGPFADSASLIETGILERSGINTVGVAGHPEGHPLMSTADQWHTLVLKCNNIERRGMTPLIFTQFSFDAEAVLTWLRSLREQGLQYPVRIGVAGPANIAVLARYATLCGVNACASMWSKYGLSLTKLLRTAGPDTFVNNLVSGITPSDGPVGLHFFPFGGIEATVHWTEQYRSRTP